MVWENGPSVHLCEDDGKAPDCEDSCLPTPHSTKVSQVKPQSQELALATAKRSFKTHSQRRRKVKRREIQRNTVRGKVKTNRKNRDIRTIDLKQLNFSNL